MFVRRLPGTLDGLMWGVTSRWTHCTTQILLNTSGYPKAQDRLQCQTSETLFDFIMHRGVGLEFV
jgi:hypothetical protein